MFGSQVLETAIGLVFFFLSISLFVTALQEFIATFLKLRARTLASGISELLELEKNQHATLNAIVGHPRITPLDGKLSYVSAQAFASTVVHVLNDAPTAQASTFDSVNQRIQNLPDGRLKDVLKMANTRAQGDITQVEQEVANWFDESMNRLSGRYKRLSGYISLGLGAVLAFGLQLDALRVVGALWVSPAMREQATAAANATAAYGKALPTGMPEQALQLFGFQPLFHSFPTGMAFWGCLVTAFAISLGAPFWFDTLQGLLKMQVRGTGNKPAA